MSGNEAALREKQAGNEAYKKKDFVTAHQHYDKAIELDPSDMTFPMNKAAAYLEEGKFEECIAQCEKAIEVGRENRADYKQIAKALGRIATAYQRLGKNAEALKYIEKSLSEYRDPELVKKRVQLEKQVKEEQARAYINPEIAEEEKAKGNEHFKNGRYPEAIKHYTEAIKRNPDVAAFYSNRAACYHKLAEWNMALNDCEKCIEKDPKFIKGYIRKGAALMALKETSRAMKAYEEALSIDQNNAEAQQGLRNCIMEQASNPEEARKKALNDPEIQAILTDPAMRLILEQMSQDPKSAQEHLKNPIIREKLGKLMEAGIVQMR